MKDNIDRPLAAILTLNTIAHTVGAAGVGAQSAHVFGDRWVAVTSAVLTLLILFLSEIIPKTLGAVYARYLATFTAYTVKLMIVTLYPLVVLSEWLAQLVAGRTRQRSVERDEISSMADLGFGEGVLNAHESRVIKNLLQLRNVNVSDIMTPRAVVVMFPQTMTVGEVFNSEHSLRFARIPVYRENPDDLTGVVHRYDILQAHREGRDGNPLEDLAQPIHTVPEHGSVASCFDAFVHQQQQLFQVVDEYGGTAGIITLEDAMETLLGVEIVDETDSVEDMRKWAQTRAKRRQRPV
jgi:CBS domain containing-hemolysin-like protein